VGDRANFSWYKKAALDRQTGQDEAEKQRGWQPFLQGVKKLYFKQTINPP